MLSRATPKESMPRATRLSDEQAIELLRTAPLVELMRLADERRMALHGKQTYFVHSLNLNPTNLCENKCDLCAFWREAEHEEAYTMSLEAAEARLRDAVGGGLTDLHVVGGLSADLDVEYYEQLFSMAKSFLPKVCIQGLTAVEVHYLAGRAACSTREALARLKAAGLDTLPGGGAEIFSERVRQQICKKKISADTWLQIHGEAHDLGLSTNATMLFGHIESTEEIIDHMARLRKLQDRTGGIAAFIPLPFHPAGTRVGIEQGPSGYEIARTVAVARLFLDNVPHVRVLANYVDRKLLEVLTRCGVDDLGGTSQEERIAKAAGAPPDHRFVSVDDMVAFVRRLGLEPRLVNSLYVPAGGVPGDEAGSAFSGGRSETEATILQTALAKARAGERVSAEEAVRLHDDVPFQVLGELAGLARQRAVPGDKATFVVDRNLSLTNVCTVGCRFCAFHVKPHAENAFALSIDDVVKTVRESIAAGATQVLIQGGLNPDLSLDFFEELLAAVKGLGDICVHSLSPAEIIYLAKQADLTVRETLERLQAAGLDSLPGGGAEILVDEVRARVSPRKLTAGDWLDVMRTAHDLGMRTTATMVYGLGETTEQRVAHLMKVRALQDETGGFTAFIPWSFQSRYTQLAVEPQTGVDYLRVVAMARLVLDNIDHIQAGWVTEGPDMAQIALHFGADDFGGVLMEEQVVRATGMSYAVTRDKVVDLIRRAGFIPTQRTTQYEEIGVCLSA